jgi:uncharacterized protein with PIN domain
VKFLVDSMLPPRTVELLSAAGHDAVTPAQLGAQNLPDDELIHLASIEGRVIITENASDFAKATCTVLLVRKSWWPAAALAQKLSSAIDRWVGANPEPGPWAHWLTADMR